MQWLEETYLKYLDDWEASVQSREGKYTDAERNCMLLSQETHDGLRMTGIQYMLNLFFHRITWDFLQLKSFI